MHNKARWHSCNTYEISTFRQLSLSNIFSKNNETFIKNQIVTDMGNFFGFFMYQHKKLQSANYVNTSS